MAAKGRAGSVEVIFSSDASLQVSGWVSSEESGEEGEDSEVVFGTRVKMGLRIMKEVSSRERGRAQVLPNLCFLVAMKFTKVCRQCPSRNTWSLLVG